MPMFSKKHYEVLASVLSQSSNKQANLDFIPHPAPTGDGAATQHQRRALDVFRDNLVNVLIMDNPRFDKDKFIERSNAS